eukprot:4090455-Prymnesium_polylepis.1
MVDDLSIMILCLKPLKSCCTVWEHDPRASPVERREARALSAAARGPRAPVQRSSLNGTRTPASRSALNALAQIFHFPHTLQRATPRCVSHRSVSALSQSSRTGQQLSIPPSATMAEWLAI